MSSCLTPVIQQRKQWNNTQKSGVQVLLTVRGDFFTAFLLGLIPKEKRREARPNEIGLSDFLHQDFQHGKRCVERWAEP